MTDNRLPCFVIGLGVGAALGLLLAPKAGNETREDLRDAVREGGDFVSRNSKDLRKLAVAAVDRGKEAVESQRSNLESSFRAGVEAYRNALGEHW